MNPPNAFFFSFNPRSWSDHPSGSASPTSVDNFKDPRGASPKKLVLVTGGAGFIGSHVCEHLLARGDDVALVDEVNDYYDVRIKRSNLRRLRNMYGEARLRIYEVCVVGGGG